MTAEQDWQSFASLGLVEAIDRLYREYAEAHAVELHDHMGTDPEFAVRSFGAGWWEEISLRPAGARVFYNSANDGGFGTKVSRELWGERERWLIEAIQPLINAIGSGVLSLSGYVVSETESAPAVESARIPVPNAWFDLQQVLVCRAACTVTPLDRQGFSAGSAIERVRFGSRENSAMPAVKIDDPSSYPDEPPAEMKGRFKHADWPVLARMRALILEKPDTSVREAAETFADQAGGRSNLDSKVERIRKAYSTISWSQWDHR